MELGSRATRRTAILASGAMFATIAAGHPARAQGARATVILFERATVKDYEAWAKVFGAFTPDLKAAGVIASTVYRSVKNPNDVTVAHEFPDVDKAKAFLDSAALKRARPSAGVDATPTVWFAQKVYAERFF